MRALIRRTRAFAAAGTFLAALAAVSCAEPAPSAVQPQLTTAVGVPAYRVVAPSGARSVLIGSLHEAADGLRQPSAAVFDGATQYVVEGVASGGTKAPEVAPEVRQGRSSRAPWAAFLTAGQIAEVHRRARCIDQLAPLSVEAIDAFVDLTLRYSSAQLFAGLAVYRCASPGLKSRDTLLAEAAAAHGLKPVPLESQQAAQAQRDGVPERIYVATAYDAFLEAGAVALKRTVEALNAGDYEAVGAATRSLARSPEDAEVYYDIMVAQRNRAWMPVLRRCLDAGNAVVVVGAYHLPGPDGLVTLLESAGYRVERTELPGRPEAPTP